MCPRLDAIERIGYDPEAAGVRPFVVLGLGLEGAECLPLAPCLVAFGRPTSRRAAGGDILEVSKGPMRLPRLTTRRLMVVVAVVAALLAGWIEAQMRRRRAEYRREASRCAQAESVFRLLALGDATRIAAWEGSDPSRRAAAAYFARSKGSCRELAEYYTLQRKRYERAADRPWVPLPPGPPEPSVGSGIPD